MTLKTLTSNIYNNAKDRISSIFLRYGDNKNITKNIKKKGLYKSLRKRYQYKVKMELQQLRDAIDLALNPTRPDRRDLYAMYIEAMRETKLKSLVRTFTAEIQQSGFQINPNGKADDAKKKLFEKSWFTKYIKHCVQAYFYSHVLIEFKPKKRGETEFKDLMIIPREHVRQWDNEVVLSITDSKGIDYTKLPLCIEFGDKEYENLGLLETATEEVIRKKYARTDWSIHSEKFGMPIVHIKTATRDDNELDALEDKASSMGSNGYMITADSDELNFAESNKSNPSNMYLPNMEYVDKMLSLLILGQTSTSDEKSHVGSAEVHERVKNAFVFAALRDLQQHINEDLIPFLIKNGYPLSLNDKFQYTDLLPKEKENKKDNQEQPFEPQKKKHLLNRLTDFYKTKMHIHLTAPIQSQLFDLEDLVNQSIERIYQKRLKAGELDKATWKKNVQTINDAFEKSGLANISYDNPRADLLYQFRRNVEVFAAFKNHANISDMVEALVDKNGNVRSFADFKKEAAKIGILYNTRWLEAEHRLAIATTQQAVQWQDYQKNKDLFPNLKYRTMGDARVRDSHKALNGVTMPIDDAFWDEFYPPNGWGCRCGVLQVAGEIVKPPKDLQGVDVDKYFRFNAAKSGEVFGKEHPYFQDDRINELTTDRIIQAMNKLKYDDYDTSIYNKVSFDTNTGGYIVKHKDHTPTNTEVIAKELEKDGLAVELLEYKPNRYDSPLATVNGKLAKIVEGKTIDEATKDMIPYLLTVIKLTEKMEWNDLVSQLKSLTNNNGNRLKEVIVILNNNTKKTFTYEEIQNL